MHIFAVNSTEIETMFLPDTILLKPTRRIQILFRKRDRGIFDILLIKNSSVDKVVCLPSLIFSIFIQSK